jgi:hypothetical protein
MNKKNDNLEFAKILAQLIPSIMKNQPTLESVQGMPDDMLEQMLYNQDPAFRKLANNNNAFAVSQSGWDVDSANAQNRMLRDAATENYTYGGNPNDPDRSFRGSDGYSLNAKEMLDRAKFSNKGGR